MTQEFENTQFNNDPEFQEILDDISGGVIDYSSFLEQLFNLIEEGMIAYPENKETIQQIRDLVMDKMDEV